MDRKWKRLDCMFCDMFDEDRYVCSKNEVKLSKLESCPLDKKDQELKAVKGKMKHILSYMEAHPGEDHEFLTE